MDAAQIDRWLLCATFDRARVFRVALSQCTDEFGNRFGADGDHFFVRALASGPDRTQVRDHLRDYYAGNAIRSMNDVVGHDIGDPAGAQYFCPWEADRIRPLERFLGSHKAGPTPDEALERIVDRLLGVVESIRNHGFRQYRMLDGFPRIYTVVGRDGGSHHVVRDGQHRIAALSHLGQESVLACYEADYWQPSRLYRVVTGLLRSGNRIAETASTTSRIVRATEVTDWPHVKAGRLKPEEALAYFESMFELRHEVAA